MTTAVPCFPSDAAMTVADPVLPFDVASAVEFPVDEIVRTLLPLPFTLHSTVRPVRTFPSASRNCAVRTTEVFVRIAEVEGMITIVATAAGAGAGAGTLIAAEPLLPSLVAVIVALPGATAVTTPLGETVATCDALEDQVTVRPDSVLPDASRVVAERASVPPTAMVPLLGLTATEATGAGAGGAGAWTVMEAEPLLPSLVAVIVVLPAPTA